MANTRNYLQKNAIESDGAFFYVEPKISWVVSNGFLPRLASYSFLPALPDAIAILLHYEVESKFGV